MTWFKVDDHAAFNAKVLRAGNEAFGAWTRAGSWTSAAGKDGFIPDETAELIAKKRVWERAESAGLLTRVEGGWTIHNYLKYNPSASDVASKREARAQAGSKGGKRSVEARAQAIASAHAQAVASNTFQPPSRPVPTRPDREQPTVVVAPAAPPAKKVRRGSTDKPTQIPADGPDFEAWVDLHGFREALTGAMAAEFLDFVRHHRGKGNAWVNWPDAWAKWQSQAAKWAEERSAKSSANVSRFARPVQRWTPDQAEGGGGLFPPGWDDDETESELTKASA